MNDPKQERRIIHEAIAKAHGDSVIGGWVLVAELMTPDEADTNYQLFVTSSDATGESDLRPWTARGWCAEVGNHGQDYFDYDGA